MERPESLVPLSRSPASASEARRVDLLYGGARVGLLVAPAVAAVCTVLLWSQAARPWLLTWLASILLISGARYGLLRHYTCRKGEVSNPARWESLFIAGTVLHGIAWGALALIAAEASYPLQVFAAFAIGGMVIGAIALLGASRVAFVGFAVPSMGMLAIVLLAQPGDRYLAMGALILIFALTIVRILNDHHRALVQNIERGIVNERLLAEQRGLFDAATVGIAFVRDGRIVDCNRWLARMLGWTREELLAAPHVPWADDATRWDALVAESTGAVRAGDSYRCEIEIRRKDGTPIGCELSSQPVRSAEPELGVVLVLRDLTARLEHERAVRASEERLDLVESGTGILPPTRATCRRGSRRFSAIRRMPTSAPRFTSRSTCIPTMPNGS
jgi:PAS domain S-box-containing protein